MPSKMPTDSSDLGRSDSWSLESESSDSVGGRKHSKIAPKSTKKARTRYMMLIDPFQMWVTGLYEMTGAKRSDQTNELQNQIGTNVSADIPTHKDRPKGTSSLASAWLGEKK